jgi:hypothetical protein
VPFTEASKNKVFFGGFGRVAARCHFGHVGHGFLELKKGRFF